MCEHHEKYEKKVNVVDFEGSDHRAHKVIIEVV
jgi:hypothetical protein